MRPDGQAGLLLSYGVAEFDDAGTTDIGISAFANTADIITGSGNDTVDFNGAGRITGTIDGGGQSAVPPGG